jgi:threonine synthase
MVVAVAKALEEGNKAVMCASTGNTSASAAAFAAHCGLQAYVLVPHGRIAQGKLAQAVAHGAKIIAIDGNFDDALRLTLEITGKHPIALVNSLNPYRIEGQKTRRLGSSTLGRSTILFISRHAGTSPPTGAGS